MALAACDQLTNKSHDKSRVKVRRHQRSTALRRCLVVRLNLVEKKIKGKEINDINRCHATHATHENLQLDNDKDKYSRGGVPSTNF